MTQNIKDLANQDMILLRISIFSC